jgi:glycosyltransferase involved in cell wall biosynthesis
VIDRPLQIWHVGAGAEPAGVDGVARYVWTLAAEQAAAGHTVTLALRQPLGDEGRVWAERAGLRTIEAPRSYRGVNLRPLISALRREQPDVVHLHGSWMPNNALFALELRRRRVPYVHSPHGGYAPAVMVTSRRLRGVYAALLERPLNRHAGTVTACIPAELDDIRTMCPRADGLFVPAPVTVEFGRHPTWVSDDLDDRPVVFLGRYEPYQKGLDRLAEIAAALPAVDFQLHGVPEPTDPARSQALIDAAPPNMRFNGPVFGGEKTDRLATARLFIQPSRFEGFSLALGEAMMVGVPCAISAESGFAATMEAEDLGLVLPSDTRAAAGALAEVLDDHEQLSHWGKQAQRYAQATFSPDATAAMLVDRYRSILARGTSEGRPG